MRVFSYHVPTSAVYINLDIMQTPGFVSLPRRLCFSEVKNFSGALSLLCICANLQSTMPDNVSPALILGKTLTSVSYKCHHYFPTRNRDGRRQDSDACHRFAPLCVSVALTTPLLRSQPGSAAQQNRNRRAFKAFRLQLFPNVFAHGPLNRS